MKSIDVVEDVIILVSQIDGTFTALDFDGKSLFSSDASGYAKFLPNQTVSIFVAGKSSGVVDLNSGEN